MGDKSITDAIDLVIKKAPIMASMPLENSSDGLDDVYEVVKEVDEIPQTDLDSPVPEIDLDTDVEQLSLMSFAGKIIAGLDKLKKLKKGMGDYITDRIPKHTQRTMESMEKTWINMARAFCVQNYATDPTRVIDDAGSNNTNFSIIAVDWTVGETTGLVNEDGFGTGKIFEEIPLWLGGVGESSDGVPIQGVLLKNYIGFKFANPLNVGAIINIDIAATPSEEQLGDLIDDTNATALYMHPYMARRIGIALGLASMEYRFGDTDLVQSFLTIDGIPIITSRQFPRGTEANITL
jgi:hypothetical protein